MHNLNWSLCSVLSELVFSHGGWWLPPSLTIPDRHDFSLDASTVRTRAGGHEKSFEKNKKPKVYEIPGAYTVLPTSNVNFIFDIW